MTKEETKKVIEIMQAYVDGKQIQCIDFGDGLWNDINNPKWDFDSYQYRVKPEPKLRPYTFDEMCEAVKKHGLAVKSKYDNSCWAITSFSDIIVIFNAPNGNFTYEELLDGDVWLDDNSPCGILEE